MQCEPCYYFRSVDLDFHTGGTHRVLEGYISQSLADKQCIKAQGIDRKKDLPYYSPLGAVGTWSALIFCILVTIFKIRPFADIANVRARFRYNCTEGKAYLYV